MRLTILARVLTMVLGGLIAFTFIQVAQVPQQLDEAYAKMTPEERKKHRESAERLKKLIFFIAIL